MRGMPKPESRSDWRAAVLSRDGNRCQMLCFPLRVWPGTDLDRCNGPLAAHHVVLLSRDRTRSTDVDNGATLCRHHHQWVHANPAIARDHYGLMGHHGDVVKDGRVVL